MVCDLNICGHEKRRKHEKQVLAAALCLGLAIKFTQRLYGNGNGKTEIKTGELIGEVKTSDTYPVSTDVELRYWVGT